MSDEPIPVEKFGRAGAGIARAAGFKAGLLRAAKIICEGCRNNYPFVTLEELKRHNQFCHLNHYNDDPYILRERFYHKYPPSEGLNAKSCDALKILDRLREEK